MPQRNKSSKPNWNSCCHWKLLSLEFQLCLWFCQVSLLAGYKNYCDWKKNNITNIT